MRLASHYHAVLAAINRIAKKHDTTPANIATAFVLQTPGVSAAILGPRNARHISELDQLDTCLTDAEYRQLFELLKRPLSKIQDDIYSYERNTASQHARIMKYNLNGMRPVQS